MPAPSSCGSWRAMSVLCCCHSAGTHGIALRGADAARPERREAFASGTMDMFAVIGRVYAWRQFVVGERIEQMRPGARRVAATAYLSYCERHAPSPPEMFRQLCRFVGIDPAV